MDQNNVVKLTEQFIKIPSYVDNQNNEIALGNYIYSLLQTELPELKTSKQVCDKNGRFNIISRQSSPTLFVCGHIDTVQPQSGWKNDPFIPRTKNNRLYGLGSCDMLGSIAAFITALQNVKNEIDLNKVMLLWYIDEEYDFLGMKTFVYELEEDINPQLALSLDGDLELRSGCRGLIELDTELIGISGHSSNPANGNNVIRSTAKLVYLLEQDITKYSNQYLGTSTINIAYIQAGSISKSGNRIIWRREGNIIPDFADCTIEVRTSNSELNAKLFIGLLKKNAKQLGLRVGKIKIRHDLSNLNVSLDSKETQNVKAIYKKCGIKYTTADVSFSGYIDIQMLQDKVGSPIYIIGAGGENEHAPNESVNIDDLNKAVKLYEEILKFYCPK